MGQYGEWKKVPERSCPKCSGRIMWRLWTSYDEAHEDVQYKCENGSCDYERWVDGIDS